MFAGALCVSLIAAGYLYYRHTKEIGQNLANHLKGMIPESELAYLQINRAAPFSFRFLQWMMANKIILNLAISKNTSHPKMHQLCAFIEGLALYYFSQLKWLSFKRSIGSPLLDTPFKQFDRSYNEYYWNNLRQNVQSTDITFHFLIPDESLLSSPKDLFKRIYDYSTDFFKDSHWQCYWFHHYYKGVYVGSELIFRVQVSPLSLQIGTMDFSTLLCSWNSSINFKYYGNISIKLMTK